MGTGEGPTPITYAPATARTCSASMAASGQSCAPSLRMTTSEARAACSCAAHAALTVSAATNRSQPIARLARRLVGMLDSAIGLDAFRARRVGVERRAFGNAVRALQSLTTDAQVVDQVLTLHRLRAGAIGARS